VPHWSHLQEEYAIYPVSNGKSPLLPAVPPFFLSFIGVDLPVPAMPTASGTRSAGSARSAPGRATARQIAPRPEAAVSIAPFESALTMTEQEPTTTPGSRTTRAAKLQTVPAPHLRCNPMNHAGP
jgi:hypothetical protein